MKNKTHNFLFDDFEDASDEADLECVEKTLEEVAALKFEGERNNFFNNAFEIMSRPDRIDIFDMRWRARDRSNDRTTQSNHPNDPIVPDVSDDTFKKLWKFLREKVDAEGIAVFSDFQSEIRPIFPECATVSYPCFAVLPHFDEDGNPLGEVICFFRKKRTFSPRYVEMLKLLAQNLSVARTRLILYYEISKQLDLAEEAERDKKAFFASVSHDIRTPLNSIIGFSELLKADALDDATRKQYVSAIATSGQELLQLINDVLDLAKLDAGKMQIVSERTDFRTLLDELKQSMLTVAEGKNLSFSVHVQNDFPIIEIDAQRIRQILFHLVGNALKFTDCGSVEMTAHFTRAHVADNTGTLVFSVADTGPGISEEVKINVNREIVRPNRADCKSGTGLGLSICRKLTDLMGGALSIETRPEGGSIVTVQLPHVPFTDETRSPKNFAEEKNTCEQKTRARSALRALLVDDMSLNLQVLKTMLKRLGVNDITTTPSAREAINILENSTTPFDFVLSDLWMPEMGGSEMVKYLRQDARFTTLPIYAVSADVEVVKDYNAFGFTGVLLKPITLKSLDEFLDLFGKEVRE